MATSIGEVQELAALLGEIPDKDRANVKAYFEARKKLSEAKRDKEESERKDRDCRLNLERAERTFDEAKVKVREYFGFADPPSTSQPF